MSFDQYQLWFLFHRLHYGCSMPCHNEQQVQNAPSTSLRLGTVVCVPAPVLASQYEHYRCRSLTTQLVGRAETDGRSRPRVKKNGTRSLVLQCAPSAGEVEAFTQASWACIQSDQARVEARDCSSPRPQTLRATDDAGELLLG